MSKESPAHFKNKDPLTHVVEAQRDGILSKSEMHGQEASGSTVAFVDTFRDTVVFCLLISIPLFLFNIMSPNPAQLVGYLGLGWIVWKTGRSALLGWSHLERLHRIVEQEKWEIDHHRDQERLELTELYRAKGFNGKLLEDVIDVFMSDGDRLLKVMIEEELGLTLEAQEHPIKQAFGAFAGGVIALILSLLAIYFLPFHFATIASLVLLAVAGFLTAKNSDNEEIPTMVWHVGIGVLASCVSYFLLKGM